MRCPLGKAASVAGQHLRTVNPRRKSGIARSGPPDAGRVEVQWQIGRYWPEAAVMHEFAGGSRPERTATVASTFRRCGLQAPLSTVIQAATHAGAAGAIDHPVHEGCNGVLFISGTIKMAKLSYAEAFSRYKAALRNVQWAFSAIADDGAVVLSCWDQYLKVSERRVLRYTDTLSRRQHKKHGAPLLEEHLKLAKAERRPIRLVIAYTDETDVVDQGKSAAGIKKDFEVRSDLVGELVEFDGDRYVVDFTRASPSSSN
jgi:hypothetical protein